jgi:O-antigen/teichoic acid export membrane protein
MVFTGSQMVALALSFVGSALMVRTASRATVGSYLLLLQAIMALTLLMQLGLAPATLRFAPMARGRGGRDATARLRARLLALLLGTWAVIAIPLFVFWPSISTRLNAPELSPAGAIVFATAALIALNQVVDAYLRSFRRYGASAVAGDILPRAVTSAGFVLLFALGRRVPWTTLALVFLTGHLVSGSAYAIAIGRTTSAEEDEDRAASPVPALSDVLGTAVTMGLRSGISILMAASAVWVLSWARPHDEVAVFGVMVSLLQVVGLVPSVVTRVVTQEFATLHADGKHATLERLVRSSATVTGLISLCTFLALIIVGKPLIRFAFGASYVPGWPILLILSAGVFVDAAVGLAGFLLQMTGNHFVLLRLTVMAAAFNIAASVLLAHHYGGLGVALANTVSLVLLNAAMVITVKRRLGIRTVAYLGVPEWSALAEEGLSMVRVRRAALRAK